ncbi:hypothetical protein BKA56DRAFT_672776 [Ilyonectria sp. MPI-CAGE-AT-0026]|nr:hypothetical protein BKA56DRAFT_672776 [Ilyonectria sp. MPI-CAGE-AT-0026]
MANTNNRGSGPPQNPTIPAVVGVSQPSFVIPGSMPAGQVPTWQFPAVTTASGFSPIPGAPVASAFVPFPIPAQNPSFLGQPVSQPAQQGFFHLPGHRPDPPPGWIPYVNPPQPPYKPAQAKYGLHQEEFPQGGLHQEQGGLQEPILEEPEQEPDQEPDHLDSRLFPAVTSSPLRRHHLDKSSSAEEMN